jgi:hypothetical protein
MQTTISRPLTRALAAGLCAALLLAETAAPDETSTPAPEAVTRAFGIPLGKRFEPAMVAKVISESVKAYRGPRGAELEGSFYRVDPVAPDAHFTAYTVLTTVDDRIYSIRAEFLAPDKASRCAVTKEIAASLEEKHGKPRGQGARGEWYAFRDLSVVHYRGIRLYANRCDQGIYEIVYSDDGVRYGNADLID